MIERHEITSEQEWLEWRKVDVTARFEQKFIPEPNSGCWLWIGAMVPDGYGVLYWGRDGIRNLKAPRAAWRIYRGPIPAEKQVLHVCDNRACVNPDHLYLGDNDSNVADRVRRRRSARMPGSTHPQAKIDEQDAETILLDPRKHEVIAAEFGVSTGPISRIKTGRGWVHVTGGKTDRRGVVRGIGVGNSKLTETAVRAIRADNRVQWKIAADYDVCQMTVSLIKQRKVWRHVSD